MSEVCNDTSSQYGCVVGRRKLTQNHVYNETSVSSLTFRTGLRIMQGLGILTTFVLWGLLFIKELDLLTFMLNSAIVYLSRR